MPEAECQPGAGGGDALPTLLRVPVGHALPAELEAQVQLFRYRYLRRWFAVAPHPVHRGEELTASGETEHLTLQRLQRKYAQARRGEDEDA